VGLFGYDLPIIAAVNGACAGIGLSLVQSCDFRFVAADAKVGTAAPKLELPAEYWSI
jgi:enoyl-CoA hydratase/carnithine racemase